MGIGRNHDKYLANRPKNMCKNCVGCFWFRDTNDGRRKCDNSNSIRYGLATKQTDEEIKQETEICTQC